MFSVLPARKGTSSGAEIRRRESVYDEIRAIADEFSRGCEQILADKTTITNEIGRVTGEKRPAQIAAAYSAAMLSVVRADVAQAYDEYRMAVFEPGLSPEQRRLLFNAGVEQLSPPLPVGELQPTKRETGR